MKRKLFVAGSLGMLAGCSAIGTKLNDSGFHKVLSAAEPMNELLIGTRGLAREYRDTDVDRDFRINGFDTPSTQQYQRLRASGFRDYKLVVDGAVEQRAAFPLAALEAMPQQTNITRHDCVEGWSAIGKWRGVPLRALLSAVRPRADARYVVFHCMDSDQQGTPYYESLSIAQANHPQALLALALNDRRLDPDHGAPVRLRVPTQLGYKSAKWVSRIEVVGSFANIYAGNGGYWEDQGYEWYAGI